MGKPEIRRQEKTAEAEEEVSDFLFFTLLGLILGYMQGQLKINFCVNVIAGDTSLTLCTGFAIFILF